MPTGVPSTVGLSHHTSHARPASLPAPLLVQALSVVVVRRIRGEQEGGGISAEPEMASNAAIRLSACGPVSRWQ